MEEWREFGLCRGVNPNVFFPTGRAGPRRKGQITLEEAEEAAARLCGPCPVKEPCLEYALRNRVDEGVWGGKTEAQRKRMRRRRITLIEAV